MAPLPVLFIGDSIIARHNRPCNCADPDCICQDKPGLIYDFIKELQIDGVLAVDGGRGGFTTEVFVNRFDQLVPAANSDKNQVQGKMESAPNLPAAAVAICLGSNDNTVEAEGTLPQTVPPSRYRQNLLSLIDRLREVQPEADLFLITPGCFDVELFYKDQLKRRPTDTHFKINRSPEQAEHYAAICKQVASTANIPVIDMYAITARYQKPESFTYDGLHYSHWAYRDYKDAIVQLLRFELGGKHIHRSLSQHDIDQVYPRYRDFFDQTKLDVAQVSADHNHGYNLQPEDEEYYRNNPAFVPNPDTFRN